MNVLKFVPLRDGFGDMGIIFPMLIGLGIIIMPMIMVIAIVWIESYGKRKRSEYEANLYAKAIEHGQELPKAVLDRLGKNTRKKSPLENGIILLSIGAGISLFFMFAEGVTVNGFSHSVANGMAMGIIPAALGVGHLIVHFLENRRKRGQDDEK